jgi:hypothetical protein
MGFLKDVLGNFTALILGIISFCLIGFSFVCLFVGAVFGLSPWFPFLLFFILGILCFSVARAIGRRTR